MAFTSEKGFLVPVIISGGVGSRLWPLSRKAHPKPFLELEDGRSLIQSTYRRALGLEDVQNIITVTNRDLFFYTKDEYEKVPSRHVKDVFLLEPLRRNSSAAIALAAHYARDTYGASCTLLVLPADHVIKHQAAFVEAVHTACSLSRQGKLVTFGIKPDALKTGYGYIEADGHHAKRFLEKPDPTLAQQCIDSGRYFWNSGMFCMGADTLLKEMDTLCPDIVTSTRACFETASSSGGDHWVQLDIKPHSFEKVRDISIDYAVFEKSRNVALVPCDLGWSDIGSWTELGCALHAADSAHNHVHGEAVLEDVTNCVVYAGSKLVAGLGLKDLIIADTPDAVLVAHKDRAQDVRKVVRVLEKKKHPSYETFPTVYRPWGSYTVLQEGPGFKIKRLEVKSGAVLSLQSHKHRSEHWVVVSGTAQVTDGDKMSTLKRNESTYIPVGTKHRLENPHEDPLIVIEVQCGNYLGEDDVVRYADKYGRHAGEEARP